MHVLHEGKETLTVSVNLDEAQHLLVGLREDGEVLGDMAQELAQRLEAIGVKPPVDPDVSHFEVVGPNT